MARDEPARLYLIAPPGLALGEIGVGAFADALPQVLAAGDVACLLLAGIADAGPAGAERLSEPIIRPAQAAGVAVLVEEDAGLVEPLGADGVHLTRGGKAVKRARAALSADAILGVCCGRSRHHAMLAGEAGADYIAFRGRADDPDGPADTELLTWWQAVMTPPCVAMGRIALADVEGLARAGADFVALGAAVWAHTEGPAAAVAEAQAALDRAGP